MAFHHQWAGNLDSSAVVTQPGKDNWKNKTLFVDRANSYKDWGQSLQSDWRKAGNSANPTISNLETSRSMQFWKDN